MKRPDDFLAFLMTTEGKDAETYDWVSRLPGWLLPVLLLLWALLG